MSTFTANMAAFLTASRLSTDISSLADLARQSDIRYSVVAGSEEVSYFRRMSLIEKKFGLMWRDMNLGSTKWDTVPVWNYPLGETYTTLWTSIQNTGLFNSTQDGVNRMKADDNFMLITESPVVKYYASLDCELFSIGDSFSKRPYAFALKKKSRYTDQISRV